MNTKLLRGYFFLVVVVLILAGAIVLLLTNMDNDWRLKVYWRDRIMPRAAWLVLAGIGGLVVWWTLRKTLPAGLAALREGKAVRQSRRTEKRLREIEKNRNPKP